MTRDSYWRGPVEAEPDFENVLKVLRREAPDRPTLAEFFLGEAILQALPPGTTEQLEGHPEKWDVMMMRASRNVGYDFVTVMGSGFGFAKGERPKEKSISLNEGAVIHDRKSFDAYQWREPTEFSYDRLARLWRELPPGMKLVVRGPGGVLENAIGLVGYERLCFLLVDDAPLVEDVFEAVGSRLVKHYELAARYDSVGAILSNDDWGFKTQTMLSPDQMRRLVFPWHKQIVAKAHAAGKPAVLHSCGNLESVFNDVIDDMRYDGKHSYEDTILPVEDAYERWGGRIAILGGIDMDFVCRSSPQEVYRRSRAMLERTSRRGGYALGTGNSVPAYVPPENYFALLAAATEGR